MDLYFSLTTNILSILATLGIIFSMIFYNLGEKTAVLFNSLAQTKQLIEKPYCCEEVDRYKSKEYEVSVHACLNTVIAGQFSDFCKRKFAQKHFSNPSHLYVQLKRFQKADPLMRFFIAFYNYRSLKLFNEFLKSELG